MLAFTELWGWMTGNPPLRQDSEMTALRQQYLDARSQLIDSCELADKTCDGVRAMIKDQRQ